jgi:hypothetical protein
MHIHYIFADCFVSNVSAIPSNLDLDEKQATVTSVSLPIICIEVLIYTLLFLMH